MQSILTTTDNKTPSSSKVNFSSFIFLGCFDWLCSVFVGLDPFLTVKWRQTGNFFQTPNLTQTVSLFLRNLSNVFACELVVLASVNFQFNTIWKIYYFTQNPRGVLHWSGQLRIQEYVCSTRALALKWLAMCMIYCVLVFKQHWPLNFSRFVKSILTGKVKLIITYFFYVFLLKNLEQF